MEEQSSRIFFSPAGGGLRTCTVVQSAGADRFTRDRPASDGLSCTAAPAPEPSTGPDLPPRPARSDDDLSLAPAAGVPWSAGSRVAPLFELCLQLAAGWLDRLESLVGFPELVGELLVRRALRLKVFDRGDQRCRRALALCVAAYPDQVLPSVRIPDLLTLSEYEEPLETVWSSLTRLDLSGCRLGDRHPALSHIANAAGLTHLYLRDCALTDAGLRNLTLPARMSGSGPHALRRVDVRDNQLSCRSLLMLCRLKPHQIAASLTVNAEDKAALQSRGYSLVEPFAAEEVTNHGWLAGLVDTWSELAVRPPTKRARTGSAGASRFYGRSNAARPPMAHGARPRWPAAVFLQRCSGAD